MSRLSHTDITTILLALGVLLAMARIFGELATRLRQPAVIGEIFAGVMLGPTVFGSIWPSLGAAVFPASGPPAMVLHGVATISVVLFLLVAGMEVDLSQVFRQGKTAMVVGVFGTVVPFGVSFLAAFALPDLLGRPANSDPMIFVLFFAIAMSISSLPVIAKTLMDINLYRTDLGMVVIAAAVFNDLVGWIGYALIAGADAGDVDATGAAVSGAGAFPIGGIIGLTLVFLVFSLTVGRWAIHRSLPWIQAKAAWPASILAFAMVLALIGAAIAESIGIHAVFGSFIMGVALGDSVHLRERTRSTIEQFVSSVFAPLFFATIGLSVNFIEHFNPLMNLVVLMIAMSSKVIGCGLAARFSGMAWRESWAVGFGLNARGAMGIILGLLGHEAGIISDELFVALVVMSLVTSMISGTVMPAILRRPRLRRFSDFLHPKGFLKPLKATDRDGAIRELAVAASSITGLPVDALAAAVMERERMMPTGVGLTVAVPHARIHGITRPLVCLGIAPAPGGGVEFNAPDGERSRMVFLILTAANDDGAQLEILADIGRTFLNDELRRNVLHVSSVNEFLALLKTRESRSHGGGVNRPGSGTANGPRSPKLS
jgi:Kef-type K+ transport system membrane component KefB/mannitol/fructose-specific phosphotransferase system IIA component (Ntr-type)